MKSKKSNEVPVGVAIGDKVRIISVSGEVPEYIPENTLAFVTNIQGPNASLQILNSKDLYFQNFMTPFSNIEVLAPSQNGTRKEEIADHWPYWSLVSRAHWYTKSRCLGQLYCENAQHDCWGAELTFYSMKEFLGQKWEQAVFNNRKELPVQDQRQKVLDYIHARMMKHGSRLYYVQVPYAHAFLIEQEDLEFRIYQSWTDGFDLQYWTNPHISVGENCEPGVEDSQNLLDPATRPTLNSLGVRDDSSTIDMARMRFGCLKSTTAEEIINLFWALGYGFVLEDLKEKNGVQALLPADSVLPIDMTTAHWLGKSAISIRNMVQFGVSFSLEVTTIEFQH